MKIRFLLHDAFDAGGGVLTVTLALAEELAKRHQVEIISVFGERTPVHPHPATVKVRVLTTRRSTLVSRLPRNRALTKQPSELVPPEESRYDYYSRWTDRVLTSSLGKLDGGAVVAMQPALAVAAARIAPRCVLVVQEHRPFDRRPRRIKKAYRRHAGSISTFLTLTELDARRYRTWFRPRATVPVRAMPNGLPSYDGPLSEQQEPVVVAAGRLAPSKGFDVLVDAWRRVADRHPDWRLDIWGDGELAEELTDRIEAAGLGESVRLRGFSQQLQAELARASIFVLSSRAEGYPRVIQEAMACALPVVSTDCPTGPREMITPGVDGTLVANEDAAALADGIIELIESGAERRRAMGSAARARVQDMSQERVARQWEQLLVRLERERAAGSSKRVGRKQQ